MTSAWTPSRWPRHDRQQSPAEPPPAPARRARYAARMVHLVGRGRAPGDLRAAGARSVAPRGLTRSSSTKPTSRTSIPNGTLVKCRAGSLDLAEVDGDRPLIRRWRPGRVTIVADPSREAEAGGRGRVGRPYCWPPTQDPPSSIREPGVDGLGLTPSRPAPKAGRQRWTGGLARRGFGGLLARSVGARRRRRDWSTRLQAPTGCWSHATGARRQGIPPSTAVASTSNRPRACSQ